MKGSKPKIDKSLLDKVSDRLLFVLAGLFIGVGIVGVVIVDEGVISDGAAAAIVASLSEALMVTGATTLIVSFALSDSIRFEPVIKRAFNAQTSRFPTLKEAKAMKADLASAVTTVGGDLYELQKELPNLASAFVLKKERIYPQSITLLDDLHDGDIRVLTTAEEDLSTPTGAEWIKALNAWLEVNFDSRRLLRVIARRPQYHDDMDRVKTELLEPFVGQNAHQWVYTDPEFALSVLLLGTRRAIFGFLPRTKQPNPAPKSRFQYAVVVTNEVLVRNLVTWFDERYASDGNGNSTTKVMTGGAIDDSSLCRLWESTDSEPSVG